MARSEPIHEWQRPKQVGLYLSRRAVRAAGPSAARIMIVSTVLASLVLFGVNWVVPEAFAEYPLILLLGATIGGAAVLCLAIPCAAFAERWAMAGYQIDERGILYKSDYGAMAVLKWKNVVACQYQGEHAEISGVFSVIVHSKNGKWTLWFDSGEAACKVLDTITSKRPGVSEVAPEPPERMSGLEWLVMGVILAVYVAVGIKPMYRLLNAYGEMVRYSMIASIVLGPGTIGGLLLRGRRILRDKQLEATAIAMNMGAWLAIMLIAALLKVRHVLDEAHMGTG